MPYLSKNPKGHQTKPKYKGSRRSKTMRERNQSALNQSDEFLLKTARVQARAWQRQVRAGIL